MIRLLVLIKVLYVSISDLARPLYIEVRVGILEHLEPRVLAGVHDSVIDMSSIVDLERHEEVFNVFALILPNSVADTFEVNITWVREESSWRAPFVD